MFRTMFIILISVLCVLAEPRFIEDINTYIENPSMFAENQEPTHVPLMPFADKTTALEDNWQKSPFFLTLNGMWKFKWVPNPEKVPTGFFLPSFDAQGWDNINVPSVWQTEGYGYNMYRNVPQALQPFNPPFVPDDLNPTGCYRTDFLVPANWGGRQIFLHFDGVKSCAFVWLNGEYVGYDQGGMTPAEYNITKLVQPGKNTLAVQVIRWTDGSYLEDQDMWRFSGIYRNVYLFSTPSIHIRDFFVTTDLDDKYRNALLSIETAVRFYQPMKNENITVTAELFNGKISVAKIDETFKAGTDDEVMVNLEKEVKNPFKWSAEKPNLYNLVLTLSNGPTVYEYLTEQVGFRKLEIKDGLALVNGVAVDFMGVNKHEHHPRFGRTMPEEMMRKDIITMKKFNVNAVRLSHYPNDPRWYDLCNEYGLYIQDEVNAECHFAESWFPDELGWEDAFMDRFVRMVQRDKNCPSVIMWSTGNECGTGRPHYLMAEYIKEFDPNRFLMHQNNHPSGWTPYVDINGPRYFTPIMLRSLAEENSQPVVCGEYAHAMGNSLGHFDEYWRLFREYPVLQGGFIWDWVDQGLQTSLKITPDASSHHNHGYVMGRPKLVEGQFGKALSLSGLDDYVEMYCDSSLDFPGYEITVEAWVYPRQFNGTNPLVTKGNTQFGLLQCCEDSLEFYIYDQKRISVKAPVPGNWCYNWHYVAGVFDGNELSIYLDEEYVWKKPYVGRMTVNRFPVCVGRNAEIHHEQYPGWMSNTIFDQVRIWSRALDETEIGDPFDFDADSINLCLTFDTMVPDTEYFSYGSGPFCINGVVFADRSVQPEAWQMKKSHQPITVKPLNILDGRFLVINYFNFTNLEEFDFKWRLTDSEKTLQSGVMSLKVPPRGHTETNIPFQVPVLHAGEEYWLTLSLHLKNDVSWAEAGYEIAFEQFKLPFQTPPVLPIEKDNMGRIEIVEDFESLSISGNNFVYRIDKNNAALGTMKYQNKVIVESGPVFNCWRAPILNETSSWGKNESLDWYAAGLDRMQVVVKDIKLERIAPDKVLANIHTVVKAPEYQEGFELFYKYTFFATGDIVLDMEVVPIGNMEMDYLPKIGLQMKCPHRLADLTWYGRGPFETYPDRKSGAKFGIYKGTIDEQYVPYVVPQDHGNKTDVRWAALTDIEGIGIAVFAENSFDLSVTPYSNIERARYAFQLKKGVSTIVNLDHRVSGVGGTPVQVRPPYRVYPQEYRFKLRMVPFSNSTSSPRELMRAY
ncbi:DUF4981 domain-containing protein [candidate division KSB1 bacterium]|nr:DUF4981 domain-containing protein [candidate division KSB1 bacterium]